MSLFNSRLKAIIVLGLVFCLSLIVYLGFLKKSSIDGLKNESPTSLAKSGVLPVEKKSPTAYSENLDQKTELKTLEFKLSEARLKHEKLLRLRSVIEGHIQLKQDLLKPAQDRLIHVQQLQNEGALNTQDVEFARSQLLSIENQLEKARQDKEKVSKLISIQETEIVKAESDLKKFKQL